MKKTDGSPTLKAIATTAGLSIAGVSMALRNHPSIPLRTCRRVRSIAKRLGYRPDPEIARLMSYLRRHRIARTESTVGILMLFGDPHLLERNSYLRRLHHALRRRARELGYEADTFWLGAPDIPPRRLQSILRARGIRALVLIDGPVYIDRVPIDLSSFATVTIGYGIGLPLHRVCQHQYQEMFQLIQRLNALGYRRLGLVLDRHTDDRTQHHYWSAFTTAMSRVSPENRVPILLTTELRESEFASWVRTERPDVVIAQIPAAPVCLEWLGRIGCNVPRDVGFAGLDVDTSLEYACSGIIQNYEQVAAATCS